jgi:hypothetical protein
MPVSAMSGRFRFFQQSPVSGAARTPPELTARSRLRAQADENPGSHFSATC